MKTITVEGGLSLVGTVIPQGSKNAALPIIFATLVTSGISKIYNVSDMGDVAAAIEIIEMYGAKTERTGSTLIVDTRDVRYIVPKKELTSKIRASSYLIGASLARFSKFKLSEFGGCNFCNRPIDMHIAAAKALGAIERDDFLIADRLVGAEIKFDKVSVGATMNALLLASVAEGKTVIYGAAREPHVFALIDFLRSAGASIAVLNDAISVVGKTLRGGSIRVIDDMIEAGTYLLLAPLTNGKITVKGGALLGLDSFLSPLADSGVNVEISNTDVTVCGAPNREISVITAPYPEYPTDLQPQMAPLMARYEGGTIDERVWQNRFSYLKALSGFGIKYDINNSVCRVYPSRFSCAEVEAPDLRGGVAAVLTALAVKGKSKINNAEIVLRGYSDIVRKMTELGANIKIKEV